MPAHQTMAEYKINVALKLIMLFNLLSKDCGLAQLLKYVTKSLNAT